MIALDTNVLVRFLVSDDARQTALARTRIQHAIHRAEALFVSDIVLCEVCWVLSVSYEASRATIETTLRDLIRAKHLTFAASDRLMRAIDAFAAGAGDFADYVILEHARAAGCETVVTFDKKLLREDAFEAP